MEQQTKPAVPPPTSLGVLRVGSDTYAPRLAASLINELDSLTAADQPPTVVVRCVGVPATAAGVKGFIIASGLAAQRGWDLNVVPYFESAPDRKRPGELMTAVVLRVTATT